MVCRYILLFTLGLVTTALRAQDMSNVSDSIFFEYAKSLKNRGNEYYALSNRIGIKQVIDEYQSALTRRRAAGNLTDEMECYFMQDIVKLNGDYHYENSDYDESSFIEAEKYFKKYRDYYLLHPGTYVAGQGLYAAHQELAQLYYKQGRYQEACDEMKEVLTTALSYMKDEDEPFDKLSQYAICQARVNQFDEAISNIDEVLDNYENTDSERYGEALRKKAKILMLSEEQGGRTSKSEALECYRSYFKLKKTDALAHFMGMNSGDREMYWMKIRPFVTDCYRLEDADAGFLYDVTLFAKGLLLQLDSAGGGKREIHATWQMVQERLKPDACAIEFIQYEKYGQQQMGALVLKKTGSPIFVKMAAPDSVWNYVVEGRTVADRLEKTNKDGFNAIDRVYNDSTGLYCLIWNKELLTVVGEAKKVFFSPDGYIHRIAIEYMLPQECPKLELYRLTSARRLLEQRQKFNSDNALVIGDVDYTKACEYSSGYNDEVAYQCVRKVNFGQLKKSREEIDSILACRKNPADSLLCGDRATEQKFRKLCGRFPIVHISSHGKFNALVSSYGTDMKPCLSDSSLSESIIVLSGANKALNDDTFNPENMQDGILSAKEISSLNMNNVEIAIMACCETGLGHITADGVYGIQRGLKNAGVGAIVMTLWEAGDDTTSTFMIALHKRLTEGNCISDAFYKTRDDFLAVDDYSINRPCYRNVFVLIDAIE